MLTLFTAVGVSPRIVIREFHLQTMLALVQFGAGVILVPGSFVGMAINGLTFKSLQTDDPGLHVAAAFPKPTSWAFSSSAERRECDSVVITGRIGSFAIGPYRNLA